MARSSASASGLSGRAGNMGRSLSPAWIAPARIIAGQPCLRVLLEPAGNQSAQVSSLAGVLRVVVYDAHQPDAQRDGRVPAVVHDPVKVGVGQRAHEPDRPVVNRIVIPGQEVSGGYDDLAGFGGTVAPAGRSRLKRKAEPLHPAVGGPGLIGA